MKKFTVFMYCISVLIGLSLTTHAQTSLIVATDDWPPYEFTEGQQENEPITGFSTEVIQAVLKQMQVEITGNIRLYPFARLEKTLFDGEIDAAYSFSTNEKRLQSCYFPKEALVESKWLLFIRKSDEGKLKFNSFDDLKGKKVGVVRAYAYTPEFWKFMEAEKNFDDVVDDETNFKKLNAGRIDFVAAEYGNASMILRKLGLADKMIPLLQNPIRTTGLYLIFNKQKVSQKFTDDFSSNLKAFKATPAYKSIYQKYF